MLRYFVKRILSTIPVLLIISVIVFSMIHLTPGDPAQSMLGPEASEEQVESLRKAMGLYDPLPVQYVNWIADILHGDFGTSVANNEPVCKFQPLSTTCTEKQLHFHGDSAPLSRA